MQINKIANRTKEISLLKKRINNNYIDTYGSTGIGKTRFLYFICDKLIPKGSLTVHINLSTIEDFDELIKLIATQLNTFFYNDRFFAKFLKYINSNSQYSAEDAIIFFNAALRVATESVNIVLCLDNTEKIDRVTIRKFEDNILRFYLDLEKKSHPNLKIITAGQRKMPWNFYRIREQVEAFHLDLFDKKSTKEMVQILSCQKGSDFDIEKKNNIIEDIHSLTLGHPRSIKLVIQHWNKLQVDDEKYQKGIATLLVEKYIQPEFIDQAKGLVKGEHYPSSSLFLLQNLAPLRFISTKILGKTLPQLPALSFFYSKQRDFFFNKLLGVLRNEHLLDWNEDRERYEFPGIVRHILLEDLKQNKTEDLIELHQEIGNVYQKLILDGAVDPHGDFIEQLYHTISWQKLDNAAGGGNHDLDETLWNEIVNYLNKYEKDAASLREMLEADDNFTDVINWENFFRSL